jgi:hypothetical protein
MWGLSEKGVARKRPTRQSSGERQLGALRLPDS